jgi:hypothetical protein
MKELRLKSVSSLIEKYKEDDGSISRLSASAVIPYIKAARNDLIKTYPKNYTRILRTHDEYDEKKSLSILRGILNYHGKKLLSKRYLKWNKEKKRQYSVYKYHIIG